MTTSKLILPATLAALIAAPALAAPTDAQIDALITAIAAAGCEVREDNKDAVLAASGLPEQTAGDIVELLLDDGRASFGDDVLTLLAGICH